MNLKKYALVAEVIGGFAVVVGLLFVGLELRQNTKMQRVTATQTLSVDYENAVDAMRQDTEIACIYVRGYQRQLDEVLRLPGVQQYWRVRRDWYSDEFQAFVDGTVAQAPDTEPELFSMTGCEDYE